MGLSLTELEDAVRGLAVLDVQTGRRKKLAITAPAVVQPALVHQLGPLTNKLAKDATIRTAVALNYALGSTLQPAKKYKPALIELVNAVASQVANSHKLNPSATSDADNQLRRRMNPITVQSSMDAVKKDLPDIQQTEVWARLIDATLATGLSMVPFVGPILASVCTKGIDGILPSGGSMLGGYISGSQVFNLSKDTGNYNSDIKAPTTIMGGLKNAGGSAPTNFSSVLQVSKTTPGTFIVEYLRERAENQKSETLTRLTSTKPEDQQFARQWMRTFNLIMNPITQGQSATNSVLSDLKLNITRVPNIKAASELSNTMAKPSKTVEDYIFKLRDSINLAGDILVGVVKSGIVDSFSDMLTTYYSTMQSTATSFRTAYAAPPVGLVDLDDRATHLAFLIIGYFLNTAIKNAGTRAHPFEDMFDDTMTTTIVSEDIFRGPGYVKVVKPKTLDPVAQFDEVSAFRSDRKNLVRGVNTVLTSSDSEVGMISGTFGLIRTQATAYVENIKSAMVSTLTQGLFRYDNSDKYKEAVSTFAACNVIVNAVWKSALTGKTNESFKIPLQAVKVLSAVGLVNLYSTAFGTISDKDKLLKIGATVVPGGRGQRTQVTWSAATAKLRYYDGAVKGASDSEIVMMYLFARYATTNINMFNILMGVEKWDDIILGLRQTILQINQASHREEVAQV